MRILARFGSAASALALAAMLGGCAAQMSRGGPQPGDPDFALATRAHAALASHDLASAIDLAERAAEQTPDDATVRLLLADAYFASGRFASAESAYRDSLYLAPAQPKVVLKLALVQIAQGKSQAALDVLNASGRMLNPADYGLAVALAGQPAEAIDVLERAARVPDADARVRQNLALAHALAGNWQAARVIASQDLAAGQVDARIQQWMAFANPAQASDQVAALVGVTPASIDPGQPVQLALTESPTRVAAVEPAPAPAPVAEPVQPDMAQVLPPAPAAPLYVAHAPQSQAVIQMAEAPAPAPEPQIVSEAVAPEAAYVPPAAATFETKAPQSEAAPAAAAKLAEARKSAPKPRPASLPRKTGHADVVVQLGAYSSPERVSVAWDRLTERYPVLREYAPVKARFASAKGTVWRLSIEGFGSQREAIQRCEALQARGGSCFVRSSKGDAPIQLASR
jgi:Flp pilus assembly protein TadD